MVKKISKQDIIIWSTLAICLCFFGGIYDFCMAFYGVCLSVGLLVLARRKKQLKIPLNQSMVSMLLIFIGFIISFICATDKGIAFIGVIRIAVLCLMCLFWSNLEAVDREKIWKCMVDVVFVVTLVTMGCYFIPFCQDIFFRAGRYGGVLQYSNSYACLLLLALIGLVFQKKEKKTVFLCFQAIVFCLGIVWSGSRSVIVLFLIAVIVLLIYFFKDINWKMVCVFGVVFGFGIAISIAVLNLDIAHLFKITLSSSTLNGRILYWRDGCEQLLHHPQGLGYMGYYFWQPQFQTGNYITKYVHNDIIQFGLDGGWLAMLGITGLFLGNIFQKENSVRNRLILIFLFLHVLFDFDLQYGFIFFVLIMSINVDCKKISYTKQQICEQEIGCKKLVSLKQIEGVILSLVGVAVGIYFFVALGSSYFENQATALAMYPVNTFAQERRMSEDEDFEAAEKITKQNGLLASAYEYYAIGMMKKRYYEDAYDAVSDMLKCAGYQSEYYNQAVYILSCGLQELIKEDDIQQAQKFLQKIQEMPQIILSQEKKATPFAYRINDKPEIVLTEEIQSYIETLQKVSLEL